MVKKVDARIEQHMKKLGYKSSKKSLQFKQIRSQFIELWSLRNQLKEEMLLQRELPLMNGSSKSATIGSDWICPSPNLFHLRILLIPLNLFLYHPLIHPQTFQNNHKRTLKRLVRFYPPLWISGERERIKNLKVI